MLDQNVTTLLAAFIGGLLTIAGGIATNYYLLSRATNAEKRKEARNILENLYKTSLKIGTSYTKILYDAKEDRSEMILIQESLNEMLILVYLHIPSLRSKFDPFYTEVADSINVIQKYKGGSVDANKYVKEISKSIEANLNFRKEIEKLVKQKGYSYF